LPKSSGLESPVAAVPKPIMLLPTPSWPPTCSSGPSIFSAAICTAAFFWAGRCADTLVGATTAGAVALAMFARKLL